MTKLKTEELKFYWDKVLWQPCCWRLEAIHLCCPVPVGHLFVQLYGISYYIKNRVKKIKHGTVLDSFVLPAYRRCGVRTAMQKELVKYCQVLYSGATSKAGLSFMLKNGYKLDPMLKAYVLQVPNAKR